MANKLTASDVVAARVREIRGKRGDGQGNKMTVDQLATRCAELGAPGLTAQALYKLEGQRGSALRRPRPVTVDELLVLALALNVAPVHLLVPPDDYEAPYPVTAAVTEPNYRVRGWVRGLFMLRKFPKLGDERQFFTEVPEDEFEAVQADQCVVCGGRPPREIKVREGSDGKR